MLLPRMIAAAIVDHAQVTAPEECCGLLAIDGAEVVVRAYPVANVERSPVRFTVDPDAHFAALRSAEAEGWSLGGVYHSHPRSAPTPSRSDVSGALDPEWLHLIVGLGGPKPELRAWRIVAGDAVEVPVVIGDGP